MNRERKTDRLGPHQIVWLRARFSTSWRGHSGADDAACAKCSAHKSDAVPSAIDNERERSRG
jgi:hypothetical protein